MLQLVTAGIILLFTGVALIIIGSATGEGRAAVGGIIGFIPFGFGNDPELVKIAVAVSVIAAAVFVIATLGVFR